VNQNAAEGVTLGIPLVKQTTTTNSGNQTNNNSRITNLEKELENLKIQSGVNKNSLAAAQNALNAAKNASKANAAKALANATQKIKDLEEKQKNLNALRNAVKAKNVTIAQHVKDLEALEAKLQGQSNAGEELKRVRAELEKIKTNSNALKANKNKLNALMKEAAAKEGNYTKRIEEAEAAKLAAETAHEQSKSNAATKIANFEKQLKALKNELNKKDLAQKIVEQQKESERITIQKSKWNAYINSNNFRRKHPLTNNGYQAAKKSYLGKTDYPNDPTRYKSLQIVLTNTKYRRSTYAQVVKGPGGIEQEISEEIDSKSNKKPRIPSKEPGAEATIVKGKVVKP